MTHQKKNILNFLSLGDDALLARVYHIRQAQETIDIQTFIWKNDDVGVMILKELYDAVNRGVKVRLLIDFWIFNHENEIVRFLNVDHSQFEVKLYNPPVEKLHTDFFSILGRGIVDFKDINQRMHNKTFIVDDQAAIIGGRNYDNMYYDRGETRNFMDMDVMVEGSVIKKIGRSFKLFWKHPLAVDINHFRDVRSKTLKYCSDLLNEEHKTKKKDLFGDLYKRLKEINTIRAKFKKEALICEDVDFVYDKPGKNSEKSKRSETTSTLQKFIACAKKSIYIQSPYFVLSKKAQRLFKQLKEKHKRLDVIVSTNSLAVTDNVYAYAMLHKDKRFYIKDLNIHIFELKPVPEDLKSFVHTEQLGKNKMEDKSLSRIENDNIIKRTSRFLCIHAKIFVIDSDVLWIGSYNADIRSEELNTEVALIIKDTKAVQKVKNKIKTVCHPRNSWVVAPKKYVPVLTEINDELTSLSSAFPLIDLWPFRNVTCYELKKDAQPVSLFHKNFYEAYKSVGAFPGITMNLKEKQIKIHLIKMFGKIIKPIV